MPDEELNPDGTPSTPPADDEGVNSGGSPEGADQQGDNINKTPESEVPEGYTKGLDGLLYNDEFPEDRFKGIFGAWQKDHQRLTELEKSEKEKQAAAPGTQEDATQKWLDWLEGEFSKRQSAKVEAENASAKAELDRVLVAFPGLEADNILDTAIKYKTDLATAAQIMSDVKTGASAKAGISADTYAKKMAAGKIAGKPGAPQKAGLSPYNPDLSLEDNVREGRKELGV